MAVRIERADFRQQRPHGTVVGHRLSGINTALEQQPIAHPCADVERDPVIPLVLQRFRRKQIGEGEQVVDAASERKVDVVQCGDRMTSAAWDAVLGWVPTYTPVTPECW